MPGPESKQRRVPSPCPSPLPLNQDYQEPSLHLWLCFQVGTISYGTRGRQDQARASETFAYKLNSANDCFLIHTLGCSLSCRANKVTRHLPLLVTGTPYLVARLGEVREPSNVPQRLRRSQIRGAGSAALISASTVRARALPILGEESRMKPGPPVSISPTPQARVSLKKAESCACSKPAEQQSNSQKVGQFKVPVSTATSSQTIWVAGAFSLRSHFFSPPQIAFFLYY